jgi:DNA-binding NtrC family response regulator
MLGIAVLEAAKQRDPETDIVIMTGYPEMETAIQALRLGAYDYLIKPLEWVSLHHSIKRIIERRYLRQEVTSLRSRLSARPVAGELIGSSARIRQLKDTIAKVAAADTAVIIEGESGTGKEVVATAIHHQLRRHSGRLDGKRTFRASQRSVFKRYGRFPRLIPLCRWWNPFP